MTLEQFADELFGQATGWLGWSPDLALSTPIPQILLALEGRVDWAVKTNPWGGSKGSDKPESKAPIGDRLTAAFRALGARKSGQ